MKTSNFEHRMRRAGVRRSRIQWWRRRSRLRKNADLFREKFVPPRYRDGGEPMQIVLFLGCGFVAGFRELEFLHWFSRVLQEIVLEP